MKRWPAAVAACALGGSFLGGLSACEGLLSVGGLSERGARGGAAGDDANDVPSGDSNEMASGDAGEIAADQASGDEDVLAEEAPKALPDGGEVDGAGSPFGESGSADGEAGKEDAAEAGPMDAGGSPESGYGEASSDSALAIADARADATAVPNAAGSADASAVESGPPDLCAPGAKVVVMAKSDTSVAFGTLGAVCVKFAGTVSGWNASNAQGRSVTALGSTMQVLATIPEGKNQPAIGPGSDGFIYWNFTAGMYTYAAMIAFK
jgi:hypothetical protein